MSESQLTRVETFPFAYGAIRDACKENGNPMPHYQIDGNDFTVVFDAVEGTAKDGLIYKDNLNPGQNTWDAECGKVRADSKATEKATEKLTENQKKIMEELARNPNITQNELSEIVGIHRVSISENMTKLQKLGLIRRVGGDKGGYWEIIKDE